MKGFFLFFLFLFLSAPLLPAQEKTPFLPKDKKVFTTESGLKYCVLHKGDEGPCPALGDTVTVHRRGWFEDGTVFDSTEESEKPVRELLLQNILGLREGIQLMTRGSKFKFVIPPDLAFGTRGRRSERGLPRIPPAATLIMDVELVDFEEGPELPEFNIGNLADQKMTDSSLVFEVLEPGKGEKPQAGVMVKVGYAFWNKRGHLIDCSEVKDNYLYYLLGRARMPLLNEGVEMMREGARFRFEVPPEMAFGRRGAGPLVPPNSPTVWELELARIVKPPAFNPSLPEKQRTTASGLKYEILREGKGVFPEEGFNAMVHYIGWLEDGTEIDNSYVLEIFEPIPVGMMIEGMNEGLQLMQEGAVFKFTIPPELGYGKEGRPPSIPPDVRLIYHVELVKVIDPRSLGSE